MKMLNRIASSGAFLALALGTQSMVASAAPQLTIQSEQQAHPRVVDAIRKTEEALKELHAAPTDFGGNKAAAENDLKTAIHSMKKALYYRLHMDDAAIDRAQ